MQTAVSPSQCAVLVPCSGGIVHQCERGLRELEAKGYAVWRVPGFAQIDLARSQLATDAMRQGFQETVWIDGDVVFSAADVDRLRNHNLPIVCGIYPKKGMRELAVHILPGTEGFVFGRNGGLQEILYAATGFLYVRRDAYALIQAHCELPVCNTQFNKPLIPYFQPLIHTRDGLPWYLGEDYAFCERARRAGLKIWADTTIRLWHVGDYHYGWEDAGHNIERFSDFQIRL